LLWPIADDPKKFKDPTDNSEWLSFRKTDIQAVKGAGLKPGDIVSFKVSPVAVPQTSIRSVCDGSATARGAATIRSESRAEDPGIATKEFEAQNKAIEIIVLPPNTLPFDCSEQIQVAIESAEASKKEAKRKRALEKRKRKREISRALKLQAELGTASNPRRKLPTPVSG